MATNPNVSRAIEAGASVEDVNNILARAGEPLIQVTEGERVSSDVPGLQQNAVGRDLVKNLPRGAQPQLNPADSPHDFTASPDAPMDLGPRKRARSENPVDIGEAAVIASEVDGTPLLEAGQVLAQAQGVKTTKQILDEETSRFFTEDDAILNDAFNSNVGTDPQQAVDRLYALQDIKAEQRATAASPIAPSVALVESLRLPFSSPETAKREANSHYYTKRLGELWDNMTKLEIFGDLAMEFVFVKPIIDMFQATGTLNPARQDDVIRDMVTSFRAIPADQQRAVFEEILQGLLETQTGLRTIEFMEIISDPTIDVEQAISIIQAFSVVDSTVVLTEMAAIGKVLSRSKNLAKLAAKFGNNEKASEIVLATWLDETGQVMASTGTDIPTLIDTSMPMHNAQFNVAIAEGLAPDVQRRILEFRTTAEENMNAIIRGDNGSREGALDLGDQERAFRRLEEQFDRQVNEQLKRGEQIATVRGSNTPTGASFEFEIVGSDGKTRTQTFSEEYDLIADTTSYERTNGAIEGTWLTSPKLNSAGSNVRFDVDAAIRLDNIEQANGAHIAKSMKEATSKISKQDAKRVDSVLAVGSDNKTVYNAAQLRAGVNGTPLTEPQIEAYYFLRSVFDSLGDLQNGIARRDMTTQGFKGIRWGHVDGDADFQAGRVARTSAEARDILKRARTVFDSHSGKMINRADLEPDALHAGGFRIVRLAEDVELKTGERVRTAIIKVDDVTDLPPQVMTRNIGYVPRVNKNTTYFVRESVKGLRDGLPSTITKVIRAFDNEREANIFGARLTAENPGKNYLTVRDGELESAAKGTTGLSASGSPFWGPRKQEKLDFGLPEDELQVTRASSMEALSLYAENLKRFASRNEARIGSIQKWEKTANEMYPHLEGRIKFSEAFGENLEQSPKLNFLINQRDQINQWAGIQSKSERYWTSLVERAIEGVLPITGRGIAFNTLHSVRTKDPLVALKSAAFHTLLGFYNPVQLIVQGQGAAVAVGIIGNPAKVAQILRKQQALQVRQNMDRSIPYDKFMLDATGWKADELEAVETLWRRSGLYEGMFANADYEGSLRGFSTTAGAFKRALDNGLYFYRAGESFNRRMAFMAAIDEVADIGKLATDSIAYRKVLTRANDILLNLGRSNRAGFQKGWSSAATQFMQVSTKTYEQVLRPLLNPRNSEIFTPAERFRILGTQLGLYGSAGLVGGTVVVRAMGGLAGIDNAKVDDSPLVTKALNGGAIDLMLALSGADVEASSRLSLVQGVNDLIIDLSSGSKNLLEYFLGPSNTISTRYVDKWKKLYPIIGPNMDMLADSSLSPEASIEAFTFLAKDVGELAVAPISFLTALQKANMLHTMDRLVNSKGDIIRERNFNWLEDAATAFGFRLGDEVRLRDLSKIEIEQREAIKGWTDVLVQLTSNFLLEDAAALREGKDGVSDIRAESYRMARLAVAMSIENDLAREAVEKAYENRMRKMGRGSDKLSIAVTSALSLRGEDLLDSSFSANNRLAPLTDIPSGFLDEDEEENQ